MDSVNVRCLLYSIGSDTVHALIKDSPLHSGSAELNHDKLDCTEVILRNMMQRHLKKMKLNEALCRSSILCQGISGCDTHELLAECTRCWQ